MYSPAFSPTKKNPYTLSAEPDGFLEAVSEALTGKGGNEISFADAQRSVEYVTAIYMSARSGRQVTLPIGKEELLSSGSFFPKSLFSLIPNR